MTSGVRLRPAEQVLISRARDFLAAGPADAVDLIAHVCQLPGPPRFVADHMAVALLSPWEEFSRDGDGRWRLVALNDVGSWTVAERPLSPGKYGSAGGTELTRALHGPVAPVHSPQMRLDESALTAGVAALAALALTPR